MAIRKRALPGPAPAAPLASSVGYAGYLGLRPSGPLDLVRHISKGLSYHALEQLRTALDLPLADLAELVSIPARTLHRRKEEGRLQPDESDRLVRLSRVWGRCVDLFEGNGAEARHWLGSPQLALGGQTPLALTSTEVGAREVESLIGRLEHGVFS